MYLVRCVAMQGCAMPTQASKSRKDARWTSNASAPQPTTWQKTGAASDAAASPYTATPTFSGEATDRHEA